jgi:dipeptidyl aminopeptidase/acylaminoacyl peptidase
MCKKNVFWVWGIIVVIIFCSNSLSQVPYQITHETEGITDFVWSPDGTQFAYVAMDQDTTRLYLIDVDGSDKTLLSNEAYGNIDWKNSVIVFKRKDPYTSGQYSGLIKRIDPDGSNETTIIGPHWYGSVILRADANWILYEDAPGGWWNANRCDLNGNDVLVLETNDLVQQVGWFGNNHIIYGRGPNYNTTCGIHKVNFDGAEHIQLTPEDLPNNNIFIGSPDTSKILYCNGSASSWDIWIMDPDGNNKMQLTQDLAHDYISNTRDNIWSLDSKAFYFVSERTGNGDIYKLNINGSGLTQMTMHDSLDYVPIPSPDGSKLAFISKRDGIKNIWVLDRIIPYISMIQDVPNDQGGKVTIKWRSPYLDTDLGAVSFYSIWRALPRGTMHKLSTVTQKDIKIDFSGKAYLLKSMNGEDYAWEWIANQPAHGFTYYTYTAATLYDSMSTTDGKHYFLVSAHSNESDVFFDSNIENGYSVDNLAPSPPNGLIASVVGNTIELSWEESSEPDFHSYNIYRNGSFYQSTVNNQYKDTNVEIGQSYSYKLKAVDVHENASDFSKELTVDLTSIYTDKLDLPLDYQLSQNYPNPFNPVTEIKYAIPTNCHVKLDILNIRGKKIITLVDRQQMAGFKIIKWDASSFASGTYIYRLKANDYVKIRKMILLK